MISHRVFPALLAVLAAVPLLYILAPLVHMMGSLSPSQLLAAIQNPEITGAISTSVSSAFFTTLLGVVFGLPTAFWLAQKKSWLRRLAESVLVLPLVLPPVVGGIGQLFLYGPETWIGTWLGHFQISLVNSVGGIILAQTYITSPFLILAAKAGFEEVPKELKEATHILGGGVWHVFYYVSLPLSRAAIISGILLTFARAIGEFGATMIMSYHPYTVPVDIWVQFISGGFSNILPMAALMILLAVLASLLPSAFEQGWMKRRR